MGLGVGSRFRARRCVSRLRALPEDACRTANRLTCLPRHGSDCLDRDARRPCGNGLGGLVFLDLRRAGGLTENGEEEAPVENIKRPDRFFPPNGAITWEEVG